VISVDIEKKEQLQLVISGFVLLFVAAAFPLFLVKIPALGDYLTHLAGARAIASISTDPLIAKFYAVRWDIVPNLAMDILVPFLAKYMDIYLAGKVFVFLTMGLILTGVFAVDHAIYGRFSPAPLVVFLFIYNFVFLLGLLNYLFGLGVGLWGVAMWIRLRGRSPLLRAGVSLGFVLVLFVCHLYAVGLYGLTLLCFEAWMLSQRGIQETRRVVVDAAAFGAPFLVALILLMASPTSEWAADNAWNWHLRKLWLGIAWMVELYYPPLDWIIGIGVVGAALWALWRGILKIHPVGWIVLFAGVVVYFSMPAVLFGGWGAQYRLPIAILFIMIGFTRWQFSSPAARLTFVVVVTGLSLLRFAVVGATWIAIDQEYAELRHSFEQIRPGSTAMASRARDPSFPFNRAWPLNYAECLALIDRSAFVPNVFTHRGRQALMTRSAYQHIDSDKFIFPPMVNEVLLAATEPSVRSATDTYWAHWDEQFDYLIVLYTAADDNSNYMPERLSLLYQGNAFQLYKVKPPHHHPPSEIRGP
jgi:hypothetical protein